MLRRQFKMPVLYKSLRMKINYRKTTELAMLESERRFKSLFDNAPVGIYRVNSDGFFQQANTKFAEFLELNGAIGFNREKYFY